MVVVIMIVLTKLLDNLKEAVIPGPKLRSAQCLVYTPPALS